MFCSLESPVTQDCPAPEQFWMHWHGPSSSGCLQWSSNANSWYLWYFLAAWVSFYLYVMGTIKRDHLFRREMQFHCWLQCCSSLESFLTALWHIQKSVLPGFWETSSLLHAAPGNGSLPFSSAVFSLTMAVTMLGNKIRVYQRGFTLSMTGTRQTWAITSHRWFFSLKIRPHNMSVLKDQYRLCLEKAFQQEKQHYNTFFLFSFLLLFLPLPHLQKLISLSFSRQLVLLVSIQDIAVRWSSLALPVWYLPNWLLSAFHLWDCIRHGIFAFPMKVPFLSTCATSHYLWRLILPPAKERWKPLNPRQAHLCFSLNSS